MPGKLIAYAPCGGKATLAAHEETVGGGAVNLSRLEAETERRARLMAAPANGGTLATAKAYLEAQGWSCYWDGPVPPGQKEARFELRLSNAEKDWIMAHGGSEMVRALIRAARERQEAEPEI